MRHYAYVARPLFQNTLSRYFNCHYFEHLFNTILSYVFFTIDLQKSKDRFNARVVNVNIKYGISIINIQKYIEYLE